MTKTSKTLAMLVMAGLALFTACNSSKEVTLQVKTQSGVVEGFMEDGVKKFLGIPFALAQRPFPSRIIAI